MIRQIATVVSGPMIPRLSLWLALVMVLIMPLYPFLSTWLGTFVAEPLLLKVAKDIALGVMAVVLLGWLLTSDQRSSLSRDIVLWLMLALIVVGFLVSAAVSDGVSQPLLAGVLANGRYLAIFFLVYASLRYGGAKFNLTDQILPILAAIGVVLAVLGILQVFVLPLNTLEYFGYQKDVTIAPYMVIDDNMNAPRAFATLRGPNDYAAYLLITAVAATLLARGDKRWLIAVAIIVLALVLSSSRSSWLGLVVALLSLVVVFYSAASTRTKRMMRLGVYASVVIGIVTLLAATTIPALQLAIFHSSPDDTHLTEGSTEQHWIATGNGIERAIDQPLGCGIGCAGPASFYSDSPKIAENYFVQIAEEIGLTGLIAWLSLFALIMYRLWQRRASDLALMLLASGIGLTVVGVWLHVWYDDPVALTWWAFTGLALAVPSALDKKQLE